MLTFSELDPTNYLLLLAGLIAIGLLLLGRKSIWGILDPLNFVLMGISFNVANVVYFGRENAIDAAYFATSFILFCFFLRLGMYFGARSAELKLLVKAFNLQRDVTPSEARFYLAMAIILQAIYFAFLLNRTGFGLITGETSPDIKTTIFLDGGGIFKYILWASNIIFLPAAYYLWISNTFRRLVIVSIIWFLTSSVIFGTSKSGFVLIIFDLFLLSRYFGMRRHHLKLSKAFLGSAASLGMIPALVILNFYAEDKGVSIIDFFVERLIDTGGGSFSYFILGGKEAFVNINFTDRFEYYFDTLLSILRLKEWADPNVSASISQYLTGGYQIGYGQNPYMFLNGHFLFGYWGGALYVAVLGFCFGIARSATYTNVFLYFFINRLLAFAIVDPDMAQALLISGLITMAMILPRVVLTRGGTKRRPAVPFS